MTDTATNFDFNTAGEQRVVIPAQMICMLQMTIRRGGAGDDGWLKRAADGASEGLDCEFTVVDGPYAKRKLWQLFTLRGTTEGHAEAGRISRDTLRAILESAKGIACDDHSEGHGYRCAGIGECTEQVSDERGDRCGSSRVFFACAKVGERQQRSDAEKPDHHCPLVEASGDGPGQRQQCERAGPGGEFAAVTAFAFQAEQQSDGQCHQERLDLLPAHDGSYSADQLHILRISNVSEVGSPQLGD